MHRDDTGTIAAHKFRNFLKTYKDMECSIFEASADGLRTKSFFMPVAMYDSKPKPPAEFLGFQLTWEPEGSYMAGSTKVAVAGLLTLIQTLPSVGKVLDDVASLCKQRRSSRAENAPNFNLFQILEVEGAEVSTHSVFLAHLLNPTEAHGQGDLFLSKFFGEVGHAQLASFDDWFISKELPFRGGRLDIVLQSAKARAIIVIENKISTEDHANQLGDYRRWLDMPMRKRAFGTRLLLYLTPAGDLAKNAPRNIYEPISYKGHITRWLSSCRVKPPGLASQSKHTCSRSENL